MGKSPLTMMRKGAYLNGKLAPMPWPESNVTLSRMGRADDVAAWKRAAIL